jgi:hypothetical protein
MNQSLPHLNAGFTGNPLATRAADPEVAHSLWASWQFYGDSILPRGPGARSDDLESGCPASPWRALLQTRLMALICMLVLGRESTAGNLAARDTRPPPNIPNRARTPVLAPSEPPVGVARPANGWTLRSGKRLKLFYVTVGLDNPDDDETSDDPTDDDDGWEGLNAFSETNVPVSALLLEIGCYQREPVNQSEPLWSAPPFFTSFLTMQRLRC